MLKSTSRGMTLLSLLAAAMLVLSACGGGTGDGEGAGPAGGQTAQDDAAAPVEDGGPLKLFDPQYGSAQVLNEVGGFIAEHAWGYQPEAVAVSNPIMWESLPKGDIHLNFELWRINAPEKYEEVTSSGEVLDLGSSFDRAAQGFYVPRYVIEGDEERGIEPVAPDLSSVEDLDRYADVFSDPEDQSKGRLVSCLPQWECAEINQVKMAAYGLLDDYNLQEPGSDAALQAAIKGAYEQGDPILSYYWEPTALAGELDLVRLEEPEWTEECSEAISDVRDSGNLEEAPEEAGCAYNNVAIHKGVNADWAEDEPEAFITFLEEMTVPTDDLNTVLAWMNDNDADPEAAAVWFFEEHPDMWRSWLDDDAVQRVEQALEEA